nr:MAG TPA: hypothetical protein [Caudoviricetes sp.]
MKVKGLSAYRKTGDSPFRQLRGLLLYAVLPSIRRQDSTSNCGRSGQ